MADLVSVLIKEKKRNKRREISLIYEAGLIRGGLIAAENEITMLFEDNEKAQRGRVLVALNQYPKEKIIDCYCALKNNHLADTADFLVTHYVRNAVKIT
ncbi:MAG: hypothetical protein Q7S33_04725 [Nanoarchaeota archaeon]|nr:hypothetical protein [Nanoarchaeota archaeon]